MKRSEIKNIIISMRTIDNESAINNLLGKINLLTESKLDAMIKQIGDIEYRITIKRGDNMILTIGLSLLLARIMIEYICIFFQSCQVQVFI